MCDARAQLLRREAGRGDRAAVNFDLECRRRRAGLPPCRTRVQPPRQGECTEQNDDRGHVFGSSRALRRCARAELETQAHISRLFKQASGRCQSSFPIGKMSGLKCQTSGRWLSQGDRSHAAEGAIFRMAAARTTRSAASMSSLVAVTGSRCSSVPPERAMLSASSKLPGATT